MAGVLSQDSPAGLSSAVALAVSRTPLPPIFISQKHIRTCSYYNTLPQPLSLILFTAGYHSSCLDQDGSLAVPESSVDHETENGVLELPALGGPRKDVDLDDVE